MELKFSKLARDNENNPGSNRTFMELKLRILMCPQVHTSSNRTFMELKFCKCISTK